MWNFLRFFFEPAIFFLNAAPSGTGTFEVDAKKLDLNVCIHRVSPKHRLKSHFIWIGIVHLNSPRKIEMQKYSDGRLIATPP